MSPSDANAMIRNLAMLLIVVGVVALSRQSAPPTPAVAATGWESDVLAGLGNGEPSAGAVAFLAAWHRAEGGTASYNWLNTTQPAAGDSCYNYTKEGRCLVRNYPSYEAGIQATVETLTNGMYPRTLEGLQSNQPVVVDSELATWGTGGGALRTQLEETQVRSAPRVSSKCLPTSTGQISAHFSDTSSPYWGAQFGGMHNGTDYSGNQGDPVFAPFGMTVEDVQYYGDAARIGWYVQGRFSDGYLFYAGHLGTVGVRVGDRVAACSVIGTIGEVFHTHVKLADPSRPVPCEATGCDDFERYFEEH